LFSKRAFPLRGLSPPEGSFAPQSNSGRIAPSERFAFFAFLNYRVQEIVRDPFREFFRETASFSAAGFLRPLFVLRSFQNPSRGFSWTESLHYAVFKVPAARISLSRIPFRDAPLFWAERSHYTPVPRSKSSPFFSPPHPFFSPSVSRFRLPSAQLA
jgi:hypothetical protein